MITVRRYIKQNCHAGLPYQTLTKRSRLSVKPVGCGIPPMENMRVTSPYSSAALITEAACYQPATLVVCKIPQDHHPYWPYPTADKGHLMVIANIPDSHCAPADFWVCRLIEVMHSGQLCVAFNQCSVDDETLRPDMVALRPV